MVNHQSSPVQLDFDMYSPITPSRSINYCLESDEVLSVEQAILEIERSYICRDMRNLRSLFKRHPNVFQTSSEIITKLFFTAIK